MQDWANRIGLTLQFAAVWFITPQIIGEKAMVRGSRWLRTTMQKRRDNARRKLKEGLANAHLRTFGTIAVFIAANTFLWAFIFFGGPSGHTLVLGAVGGVMGLLGALFSAVGVYFLATLVFGGLHVVLDAAGRSPHRFLITGAILFTLGFVILLTATFLPQ